MKYIIFNRVIITGYIQNKKLKYRSKFMTNMNNHFQKLFLKMKYKENIEHDYSAHN